MIEQTQKPRRDRYIKNSLKTLGRLLFAAGLATTFASVSAQDVEDSEVFTLSPFVIDASDDQGYRATTAQSGSRLSTPLSDVGAAISVVNEEFLEDTNSTDLRDILVYTAGTEVTGFGGNFSDAGGTRESEESGLGNNPGTRLRGLASADLSRGFFRTSVPFDSYNSSRLEINRGANAILFGIGSPAGIINYTPNAASVADDFGSVELQFGSFDSFRASLDYNKTLLDNQAAIRLALLQDDEKFQQNPAFNEDQRIYVAGTIAPEFLNRNEGFFSKTSLRFSYEDGEIEANNPRSLTPSDRMTIWFEPTPEMVAAGVMPKYTHDVRENFSPGLSQGVSVAQNLNRSPIIHFNDPNSATPSDPLGGNIIGRQFVINRSRTDGGTSAYLAPNFLPDALRRTGAFPDHAFYKTPTVTDRSIFDYRNILIDGDNKRENSQFEALNLTLEQLFFEGNAGIELSYDNQETEGDSYAMLGVNTPILTIDVNEILLDGSVNPNFGRPYLSTRRAEARWNQNERETFRATAFGELDFTEKYAEGVGKWFGRHVLTLLYQDEEGFFENRNGDPWYIPTNPFPYGNNQRRNSNSGKQVRTIHYIGPSLADAASPRGANLQGITANQFDNIGPAAAAGQFFLREQAAGSDFDVVNVDIVRAQTNLADNAFNASKTLTNTESQAINLQSYLLDGNLIASYGFRDEEFESSFVNAPDNPAERNRPVDSPDYALNSEFSTETMVSQTVESWSLVAKTPRGWLENIPGISSLSAHYNYSENFSPQSSRFSPFGDPIGPPSGETQEYGFTVEFAGGKAVARVNWYETSQGLISNADATGAANQVLAIHQLAFNAVQDGFATDTDGDGFPDGYVAPPQFLLDLYDVQIDGGSLGFTNPGVNAVGGAVSEGVEIEVVINPTDNWTFSINLAQQESVRDNTGDEVARLLFDTPLAGGESLADTWNSTAGENIPLFVTASPGESGTLADWTRRFILNPFNNIRLQDGSAAQELREWRFNAVTNYRFSEGKFKGFNVGGALRWQDEVAIGFPLIDAPDGSRIIDVQNPYFGPTETDVDLWVGYERKILEGKVDWKVQLNIRNALLDDDVIPVFAQPDGEEVVFRNSASRTWTITSKFSF